MARANRISGMLKITIHDSAKELRFRLEGKLSGGWVREMRQCWDTAASTTKGRPTILDLREVDFVDSDGQVLIADMHSAGVLVEAASPLIRGVVDEACSRRGCGTVEEKPTRTTNAIVCSESAGSDTRPL
jgi:anti-anti-sigma regulatory factor